MAKDKWVANATDIATPRVPLAPWATGRHYVPEAPHKNTNQPGLYTGPVWPVYSEGRDTKAILSKGTRC